MSQPIPKTCSVDGCERPAWSRGWCNTHYNRWYKHGDPGGAEIKFFSFCMTAEERFAHYADMAGGPDACHPWTGPIANRDGYGLLILPSGERIGAHRWICGVTRGEPLGPDEEARHDCDNPVCVNPAHLRPGSRQDNVDDMLSRGRNVPPLRARLNAAKTHCKRGHELAGGNLYVNPRGERQCRRCAVARQQAYKARKCATSFV